MDAISRRRFLAGTSALPSLGILAASTGCASEPSAPAAGATARGPAPCGGAAGAVNEAPEPSRFVDYDGWIVTPEDRDALRAVRANRADLARW
jgi:hypothetical protein